MYDEYVVWTICKKYFVSIGLVASMLMKKVLIIKKERKLGGKIN